MEGPLASLGCLNLGSCEGTYFRGLGFRGLGFRGLGFRVYRVLGLGFRI